MLLTLRREHYNATNTQGRLFIDGQFFCYTLEDQVREPGVKVYGKTAIPHGKYRVALTYSNRFKQVMPLLLNVPQFEGIRIHTGNTDTDTHGCILVGFERGDNQILKSRRAYASLFNVLRIAAAKEPIEIAIVDGRGAQPSPSGSPVAVTGHAQQPATAAHSQGVQSASPPLPTEQPAQPLGFVQNSLVTLRKALPLTSLVTASGSSFWLQYRWPLLAIAACAFCFWLGWHLRPPREKKI